MPYGIGKPVFRNKTLRKPTAADFRGRGRAPNFGTASSGVFGRNTTSSLEQTGNANQTPINMFQPHINTINKRKNDVTAKKEDDMKLLEEHVMEDCMSNRKLPHTSATRGLFSQTSHSRTSLFEFTAGQPLTTGQTPTARFGVINLPSTGHFTQQFPATTTSNTVFNFSSTNNSSNLFGANPFGQARVINPFQPSAQPTTVSFGQQTDTAFEAFRGFNTIQHPPSVFGKMRTDNKLEFGLTPSTSNTNFRGFGANATNTSGSFNKNGFNSINRPIHVRGFGTQTPTQPHSTSIVIEYRPKTGGIKVDQILEYTSTDRDTDEGSSSSLSDQKLKINFNFIN